jgi:hypothetical protein
MTGRHVDLAEELLLSTTEHERRVYAEMYGVDASSSASPSEELLVYAIETATGQSFDAIIERIWSTLNDGDAPVRRSQPADLQWTVLAFLIVAYLHRYFVSCPESLLRGALAKAEAATLSDFVPELRQLTISEGWRIFRTGTQGEAQGHRSTLLVSTSHPRIAERAWQVWPAKSIDPVEWIAQASVNAPDATPQLAEFLLSCQATIDPRDRSLIRRIVELWDDDGVPTAQLCMLVRGIRESIPAAVQFRRLLRKRLSRRDSESWLAAVELIGLRSPLMTSAQ